MGVIDVNGKHLILKGSLLVIFTAVVLLVLVGDASGKTITVDDDGGAEYTNIQDAIDAASDGDTVRVYEGTYYENVVVDKSVSLIGNGSVNTTIDGGESGNVLQVTVDWVNMSGFTAIGSGEDWGDSGIMVESDHNHIFENNCSNNYKGIYLESSSHCTITDNTCSNYFGILLESSSSCTITNNICSHCPGITLRRSTNCALTNNTCSSNKDDGGGGGGFIPGFGAAAVVGAVVIYVGITVENGKRWIEKMSEIHFQRLMGLLLLAGGIVLIALAANNVSATTLYVDDDAPDGGNGSLEKPYNTIQEAIDNASSGDTVRVFNGTYYENVMVNTTLSLIGNGSTNTTIDGGENGIVVKITADRVNMSGFRTTKSGDIWGDAGIRVESDHNNISENNCSENDIGIHLYSSDSNIISNNNIKNNKNMGILLDGSDSNIIYSNTIKNGQYGIRLSYSDLNIISNNNIKNNNYKGIFLIFSHSNTISNNTVQNNDDGIYLGESDSNTISYNTIQDNDDIGIYLQWSSDSNTIFNNTIIGNDVGIHLKDEAKYNKAHNNIFVNVKYGIDASLNNKYYINATKNWWGSDFGPYHSIKNPEGKGDNVTDYVKFDPWIIKPVHNIDQNTSYWFIQDAIDNATDGDTIRVYAGTYYENIVVNKTLTLIGNGSANTTIDGGGSGDVVKITTDWCNVSGFRVTGSGSNAAGIRVQSRSNTIMNNNCSNKYDGIFLSSSSNNTITNNTCNSNYRYGICLSSSSSNEIINNNCSNNRYGIRFSDSPSSSNIISNNHCLNNFYGIYFSYISSNSSSNTIRSNNCSNNEYGIFLGGASSSNTITNNTCNSNDMCGIYLYDTSFNMFANNTISGNHIGISLTSSSKNNIAHYNLIYKNSEFGINASGNSGYSINATHNYWGHFSGPYHPTKNPHGRGDQVSDYVDFTPWHTGNFVSSTASPGGNGSLAHPYNKIQDAIDNALPGFIIRVFSGTYRENLNISKSLTIIGNSSSDTIIDGTRNGSTVTINGHGVTLRNLTIRNGSQAGVEVRVDDVSIMNCVLSDSNGSGIQARNVGRLTISNCTIENNGDGVSIDPSDNVTLSHTTITGSYNGLILADTRDVWISDSNLTGNFGHDLVLDHATGITITNTPFGEVIFRDDNSSITVFHYLDLTAANRYGDLVGNATVDIKNNQGSELYSGITDENGRIPTLTYARYTANASGIHYLTPLIFKLSKEEIRNNTELALAGNVDITLVLWENLPPVADPGINIHADEDENIRFNASASFDHDGTLVRFLWDFDASDGVDFEYPDAEGSEADHSYSRSGTYLVTLRVTDNENLSSTRTLLVFVNNTPPTAVANADRTTADVGESVTFDGSGSWDTLSDIDGLNYTWFLGDGAVRFGKTFSYAYRDDGEFKVILTVRDNDGAVRTDLNLTITVSNARPVAEAGRDRTANFGDEGIFDASNSTDTLSDIDGLTYHWDFGDGEQGNGIIVYHTYGDEGVYTATITVSDGELNDTDTVKVTILNAPPIANAGKDKIVDMDEEIEFNASGSWDTSSDITGLNYTWNFGDGETGYGLAPTHTFTEPDIYTVTLTVTDDNDALDMITIVVDVKNVPPLHLIIVGLETVNEGQEFNLTGSAQDTTSDITGLDYSWDFGDNTTGNGIQVSHTYTKDGNYTVFLTVSDGRDSVFISRNIRVKNVAPEARFTPSKTTADPGEEIQFDASTSSDTGDDILMYTWNFGDGTAGFGWNVSHTFSEQGDYTVTLRVSDGKDTNETSTTVQIKNLPPSANAGTPKERNATVGRPVVLDASKSTDTPGDREGLNYTWRIGDETMYGMMVQYIFNRPGVLNVTLLVRDDDGAVSEDTLSFHVAEEPDSNKTWESKTVVTVLSGLVILLLIIVGSTFYAFKGEIFQRTKEKRKRHGDIEPKMKEEKGRTPMIITEEKAEDIGSMVQESTSIDESFKPKPVFDESDVELVGDEDVDFSDEDIEVVEESPEKEIVEHDTDSVIVQGEGMEMDRDLDRDRGQEIGGDANPGIRNSDSNGGGGTGTEFPDVSGKSQPEKKTE